MEEDEIKERNRLQTEIRAIESALTLFRSALEVEKRLSSPPPAF